MGTSAAELKVIERIKKLHAMAESAREVGNLAEAEAFMEGVAKTLAKHNMEQSVLSMDIRELTDPLSSTGCAGATERGSDKPQEWCMDLAGSVAYAHFSVMHYSVASSYVFFYGRQTNIDTARSMYTYLRDMAEREGMKAWRKQRRATVAAYGGHVRGEDDIGWYLAWLEGFAREVGRRYQAMRARVESDRGVSLVLTGARKEAQAWSNKNAEMTDEAKERMKKAEKPIKRGGFHGDAREQGAEVAKTANLRPNVLETSETDNRRMLGGN